jgi:hypothetical protein
LQAAADGRLFWSRLPGRGAWIKPEAGLILTLERGPGMAGRSLKRSGLSADGLLPEALQAADDAWRRALERCRRSGLLRSGRAAIAAGPPPALVLVAAPSRSPLIEAGSAGEAPRFLLPLSPAALGRLIGRGPRAAVAVAPAAPSLALDACLRRYLGLGYTAHPSKGGMESGAAHGGAHPNGRRPTRRPPRERRPDGDT